MEYPSIARTTEEPKVEPFEVKEEKTIVNTPLMNDEDYHGLTVEQLQNEAFKIIDLESSDKGLEIDQDYRDRVLKGYLNKVKKVTKLGIHGAMEKVVKEIRKDYRFFRTFKDLDTEPNQEKKVADKKISDKKIQAMSSEELLRLINKG